MHRNTGHLTLQRKSFNHDFLLNRRLRIFRCCRKWKFLWELMILLINWFNNFPSFPLQISPTPPPLPSAHLYTNHTPKIVLHPLPAHWLLLTYTQLKTIRSPHPSPPPLYSIPPSPVLNTHPPFPLHTHFLAQFWSCTDFWTWYRARN